MAAEILQLDASNEVLWEFMGQLVAQKNKAGNRPSDANIGSSPIPRRPPPPPPLQGQKQPEQHRQEPESRQGLQSRRRQAIAIRPPAVGSNKYFPTESESGATAPRLRPRYRPATTESIYEEEEGDVEEKKLFRDASVRAGSSATSSKSSTSNGRGEYPLEGSKLEGILGNGPAATAQRVFTPPCPPESAAPPNKLDVERPSRVAEETSPKLAAMGPRALLESRVVHEQPEQGPNHLEKQLQDESRVAMVLANAAAAPTVSVNTLRGASPLPSSISTAVRRATSAEVTESPDGFGTAMPTARAGPAGPAQAVPPVFTTAPQRLPSGRPPRPAKPPSLSSAAIPSANGLTSLDTRSLPAVAASAGPFSPDMSQHPSTQPTTTARAYAYPARTVSLRLEPHHVQASASNPSFAQRINSVAAPVTSFSSAAGLSTASTGRRRNTDMPRGPGAGQYQRASAMPLQMPPAVAPESPKASASSTSLPAPDSNPRPRPVREKAREVHASVDPLGELQRDLEEVARWWASQLDGGSSPSSGPSSSSLGIDDLVAGRTQEQIDEEENAALQARLEQRRDVMQAALKPELEHLPKEAMQRVIEGC